MNFSDETLNEMAKPTKDYLSRDMYATWSGTPVSILIPQLARELLAERAKTNVWDGAPDWATGADVSFYNVDRRTSGGTTYIRELPKSRARIIAEEIYNVRMSADFSKGVEQIEELLKSWE